jgi:hypothetical protein
MNKHDWGLINQKYAAIKQEQTDLMAEMREDLDFYRKRIYQATKDLTKNEFDHNQSAIKNAFINYVRLLIEHFKVEDIKEIMSEQLDTILEESEEDVYEPQSADEITKQFLIHGEKRSIIRIEDCFNVIKTSSSNETDVFKPKNKRTVNTPYINIRQDKFREKGVKKRSTYNKTLQTYNKAPQLDNKNLKNNDIIYESNTQTGSQAEDAQENS